MAAWNGVICVLFILMIEVVSGRAVEAATEWTSSNYEICGGVLLLVCLISMLVYCSGTQVVALRPVPPWVTTIQVQADVDTGITGSSDGISIINPNCVHRHRRGHFETDGARWGAALSKGKHVFEIYWPSHGRKSYATVGVGSADALLFVKPVDSLVGCNRLTWGLDIGRRRYLHNGEILGKLPPRGQFVPDKFYMYVDCDGGTLGWGSEVEYWGAPINIPRHAFPVHAMIGIMCENAQVTMIYRGSESRSNAPGQINTVVVPSGGPGGALTVTVVNPNVVQTQYQPGAPPPYQANPGPAYPQQQQQQQPQYPIAPLAGTQQQQQQPEYPIAPLAGTATVNEKSPEKSGIPE